MNLYIIKHHAAVAQLVEQRTENPCVVSSILTGGSKTCLFSDRFFFAMLSFLQKNVSEDLRKHWINPIENFS